MHAVTNTNPAKISIPDTYTDKMQALKSGLSHMGTHMRVLPNLQNLLLH